jgi:MGT family glycosyltransferase
MKKHTFLFFNVPTTGHVDPTLPVASELARRGHQVVYFLTEAYRERIEATGASFHAYPGFDSDYFEVVARRFNPARLATQLAKTSLELTPRLLEAIAEIRPQAIVYDSMCPWGKIAARQTGLTAVASMALMDIPPRYLLRSGKLRSALGVVARGLPWLAPYWRTVWMLRQRTGVTLPPFVRLLNWPGDFNICYTAQVVLPDERRFGEDYAFIGSPMADATEDVPFPFDRLDADRPLVYVSLGTVFNNNPRFFRTCLAAFKGSEAQVVVSTGRRLQASDLAPLPDNAIVRDYVPQRAILKRASLFISHSGANSVHHALYYGVPLLLAPQQLEEGMIAARVVELGAGLLLNRRRVTPERVRRLAQRLLDEDAFRTRAASLGEALREAGGADRAADVLEAIV